MNKNKEYDLLLRRPGRGSYYRPRTPKFKPGFRKQKYKVNKVSENPPHEKGTKDGDESDHEEVE